MFRGKVTVPEKGKITVPGYCPIFHPLSSHTLPLSPDPSPPPGRIQGLLQGCYDHGADPGEIPKTEHCRAASCADIVATSFHPITIPHPSVLPPRNRRSIRAFERSSIVSGAIRNRDAGTDTATGSVPISDTKSNRIGIRSGSYESIEKRSEVHLEATQVRSVFLCFFCWSFRARFAFGSVSHRDNFFAPFRDIGVAP